MRFLDISRVRGTSLQTSDSSRCLASQLTLVLMKKRVESVDCVLVVHHHHHPKIEFADYLVFCKLITLYMIDDNINLGYVCDRK